MSSGYIKELLLDMSLNKLPLDLRSDLAIAIQDIFRYGLFSARDLQYFDLYLQGYNAEEIARLCNTFTTDVESNLARIFEALAHESGYTDYQFTRHVELNEQYRRSGIRELKELLKRRSIEFMSHEVHNT